MHFIGIEHFNKGVMKATNFSAPKHAAIVHLTKREAQKLADYWDLNIKF
jgi:hypothetical protein